MRLVEAAIKDGNTAEQFRASAQTHANATWLWCAIGAAVWYFTGWKWALVPFAVAGVRVAQSVSATRVAMALEARMNFAPSPPVKEADLLGAVDLDNPEHLQAVERIREAYSSLLADESRPHARCMFRSTDELPYSKETIRRALTALLEYCQGVRESRLLDARLRNPELVAVLQSTIAILDSFLDVPLTELPTDPAANLRVAAQVYSPGVEAPTDRSPDGAA